MKTVLLVIVLLRVISTEFSINTIVSITISLIAHYQSTCVYIMQPSNQKDMLQKFNATEFRKSLMKRSAVATIFPEDVDAKLANINCKPLFVFISKEMPSSLNFPYYFKTCKTMDSTSSATVTCNTNSTAVIFHLSNRRWIYFDDNNASLRNFFANIYIPMDSEFLIAQHSPEDGSSEVTLTEIHHIHPTSPLEKFHVAHWNPSNGLSWTTRPVWKHRTLKGIKLKVGYLIQPPFFDIHESEDFKSVETEGYMAALWKELEERMNFKSEYRMVPDKKYGALYNGTWNGVTGMVNRTEVDASINNFMFTKDRLTGITLLPPIIDFRFPVYIKQPGMEDSSANHILVPFTLSFWEALLVTMLLFMLLLSLCWNFEIKQDDKITIKSKYYQIYYFCVFGSFSQQAHYCTPGNWSSRLVYIITYFTAVIVFVAYSATFVSYLTVRQYNLPFTDFQEMVDDGTYILNFLPASAMNDNFRKSENKLLKNVYKKLVAPHEAKFTRDEVEIIRKTCYEHKQSFILAEYVVNHLLKKYVLCNLIQIPRAHFLSATTMIIGNNNPYKQLFIYHVQEMRRTGVMMQNKKKFLPDKEENVLTETPPNVTMGTVNTFFIILFFGLVASVVVLLLEMLIFKCTIHYFGHTKHSFLS